MHDGAEAAEIASMWQSRAEIAEIALEDVRAERDTLRDALDWIEGSPENPLEVQAWARTALAGTWPPVSPEGEA
jgi:hypothetical protein